MRFRRKKGQSTLEYAVLTAIVIAGLSILGWAWFRGAYQKRIKDASDSISGGGQFDIDHTTENTAQTRTSTTNENMSGTATGANFTSSSSETVSITKNASTDALTSRRP